jgi:glycosyltransferase involved in cell wall biosynthesis
MNIVFDKKTLKVLSLFDNDFAVTDDQKMLKSMFPDKFNEILLWQIEVKINYNPCHLKVQLDADGDPQFLLCKGKTVYSRSEENKKNQSKQKFKTVKRTLQKIFSRGFFNSMGDEVIKLWMQSPYTDTSISASMCNYDYFFEKEILPVSWWGPFMDAGGYANMNREITFRLHNHHIIPKIEICPTAPQISQLSQYYVSKYTSFDFSRIKKYPKIWSFTPIPHPPHQGKNIFFTMMETETLHPEFARICNRYADEVWVPSKHNMRVFEECGVKKPIFSFPLGIDENIYHKNNTEDNSGKLGVINDKFSFMDLLGKPVSQGINSFRYLSLFGWSYRKGVDILIKSFVDAFDSKDDVALLIFSRHSGSPAQDHINVIKQETEKYAKSIRRSNYPQIVLYPHIIPERQMPSIYMMGHAFVHFSRGEGFSLPQIEAAACGLPVISCNNTGMSEYLTDDNAYLVKTDQKEICSSEMHWITSYYHGQLFPKLGKDQIEQAKKHMCYVINNYNDALIKGKKLQNLVFQEYTWDIATKRIANRIKEICGKK